MSTASAHLTHQECPSGRQPFAASFPAEEGGDPRTEVRLDTTPQRSRYIEL